LIVADEPPATVKSGRVGSRLRARFFLPFLEVAVGLAGARCRPKNRGSSAKTAAGGRPAPARSKGRRRGPVRFPLRERGGVGMLLLLPRSLLGDDCCPFIFSLAHGSVRST
jgi:hypothetical protein